MKIGDKICGLAILSHSGEDEAILGGSLMRGYLGIEPTVDCQ